MNTNKLTNALLKFLDLIELPHSFTFAHRTVEMQGNKVPLNCLQKALEEYDLRTLLVRFEMQDLARAPLPVFALYGKQTPEVIIAKEVTESGVICVMGSGQISIPRDEFTQNWQGIALLVEKTAHSREPNLAATLAKEYHARLRSHARFVAIALLTSVFFLMIGMQSTGLGMVSVFLLKVIGAGISILLIKESAGDSSDLSSAICSFSREKDCAKVIQSGASRVFGVALTDLGLAYFLGTGIFTLFITGLSMNPSSLLAWMNAACLIYSAFSLYYQKFVIKAWCPLCLLVLIVFFAEAVALLFANALNYTILPSVNEIIFLTTGVAAAALIIVISVPLFRQATRVESLQIDLLKIKSNPEFLQSVMKSGRQIERLPPQVLSLTETSAPNKLVLVASPDCPGCVISYAHLKAVIEYFGDQIDAKLVILSLKHKDNVSTRAAVSLVAKLERLGTPVERLNLLDSFMKLSPKPDDHLSAWLNSSGQDEAANWEAFTQTLQWARQNQVDHTPFIILNGKVVGGELRMPEVRRYLKFVIENNN